MILRRTTLRRLCIAVLMMLAILAQETWALAGTTGRINGTLTDDGGKPVANAVISATAPSQTATTQTDASGRFSFVSLTPDSYVVSASKDGYDRVAVSGVNVFADNTETISMRTHATTKVIANVTSRAAGNLVRAGTTSDVYSVNAATQTAVQGIGGGYNLDSAYSAIYSQPGVQSQIGNAGFGQVFYIRGSHYSQVGYEYDGIPVNRAFDNYNANSLSSFGTQETQVYTGGSPASGGSATLAGYINQVIKVGTYPGFGVAVGGLGAPAFYHKLSLEAGGASPNRNFSYYAGISGVNETLPFLNNHQGDDLAFDGTNSSGLYGAPWNTSSLFDTFYTNGPWPTCDQATGAPPAGAPLVLGALPACNWYSPISSGQALGNAIITQDRENVANLHFGLPHKHDAGRDDLQLLYYTFGYHSIWNDSVNDNGGLAYLNNAFFGWGGPTGFANSFFGITSYPGQGGPYDNLCAFQPVVGLSCSAGPSVMGYLDSSTFAPGTAFGQPANTATVLPYYAPSSPTSRQPFSAIPPDKRDALWNTGSVLKLQFQKNIGSNAYARLMGYTFYSDWLQNGPNGGAIYSTAYLPGLIGYGYPSPDYELNTHSGGVQFQFADQVSASHLVSFTANYTTATPTRFNNQYYGQGDIATSYADASGNCYNASGQLASCLRSASQGSYENPTPFTAPAGSPAALANAQWIVSVPGGYGQLNRVIPKFTSLSLEDQYRPNDKLNLNLGLRYERYEYDFTDTSNPEFNFWFHSAANSYCYDPDTKQPLLQILQPGGNPATLGPQVLPNTRPGEDAAFCYTSAGAPLLNASGNQYRHPNGQNGSILYTNHGIPTATKTMFSPRIGGTYTIDPRTVLRFSAGRYTQPTETAFEQYANASGLGAAKFNFQRFFGLGFNTPVHDNPVQVSNNIDFSLEKQLKGTDITMKLSPFYRYTTNQLVTVALGGNFASGINAATQRTQGVELAIQKGDPSRNGLSGELSYTYTNAKIRYTTLANGTNAIDALNNYIIAYNQLTGFCKTNPTDARCGSMTPAAIANVAPCYDPTSATGLSQTNAPSDCSKATDITNPYFNAPAQSLMDRNGWSDPYANNPPYTHPDLVTGSAFGPNQFAGYLNYKHDRFAATVTGQLNQGNVYGSPVAIAGLDPRTCTQNEANAGVVAGSSAFAQNGDYQSCAASAFTGSGYLTVPNPSTGTFDTIGKYRNPWYLNMGLQLSYDVSPKVRTILTMTNVLNRCFGGTSTPWQQAYKPNNYVCGYAPNGNYIGAQPGSGFFYGASGHDPANGTAPYPNWINFPYSTLSGALPFQAYLQLQVRL